MNDQSLMINELLLPTALVHALKCSDWQGNYWGMPEKKRLWYSMFSQDEIDVPQIYNYELMYLINKGWSTEKREFFLGKSDGIAAPGFLDPHKSILIGELAQDALVALNYSESAIVPSVSYLKWYAPMTLRWTLIQPNMEMFLAMLQLQ